MESRMGTVTARLFARRRRGQVMVEGTLILAALTLLAAFALSYGTLTLRAMRVMAIADASAHAGAMDVHVLPNGDVTETDRAARTAADYFARQAPAYARLQYVQCGATETGPYCDVAVVVRTDFVFPASHVVQVRSVLAYGATRGGQ